MPLGGAPRPRRQQGRRTSTTRTVARWLAVCGIVGGAIILATGSSTFVYSTAAALIGPDGSVETSLHGDAVPVHAVETADQTLRIDVDDVRYLNRVFQERSHEIAYCGYLSGGHLRPWLADTLEAGATSVTYTTANCPERSDQGTMGATVHTHPDGPARLSTTDLEALADSPYDIQCVQGGVITADPDTATANLRCYRYASDESGQTLEELPVFVTTTSE